MPGGRNGNSIYSNYKQRRSIIRKTKDYVEEQERRPFQSLPSGKKLIKVSEHLQSDM